MSSVDLKNIYKTVFVIIGTIIGAGFASGQEIYNFFNVYGYKGIIGIILSVFLIGYIIYKTFNIIIDNNINNYQEFILKIMPEKLSKNKLLCFTINNIVNIFLLISFNIMVAGFSSYCLQELNIPQIYGSIIMAILLFITLSSNINGVIKINSYLIPILIVLIIFLGLKQINITVDIYSCNNDLISYIIKAILYASYNSISLVPILISLKEHIKSKKEAHVISILSIIIMITLSLIIFYLMNSYITDISNVEMPIVYIASMMGNIFKYIYGIVILMAIFTTGISTGYGFLENVTKTKKSYNFLLIVMCMASIFFGQLKFSELVSVLYPIFGYLGIIQIFLLLFKTKYNNNILKNNCTFDINKKKGAKI